jgi:uncharacterized membrane protein (DUF485 family)
MAHGPATEWKKEKSEGFKTRLGLIMFGLYCTIYFIFIFIAVLSPKTLGLDVGKLNLAITYGMALIVVAIVLALVYNYVCSRRERLEAAENKEETK